MTRAKNIFFRVSSPFAGIFSLSILRKASGINRLVPVYHAVSDETPKHLRYLYTLKSIREFESDLDVLLEHYKPIDLHELIRLVESGNKPKEPVFHLTFDDGLSEFYHNVAPILLKKNVPATCFLNNDFIDNKDMLFRLKVSLLIDKLHHSESCSAPWVKYHDWVQKYQYGKTYYRDLLMSFTITDLAVIEELAKDIELSFKAYREKNKPYLSTPQIKELIEQGFTFGAHTYSHPNFRHIEEEEQLKELQRSVEDISSRFNLNYKVFSFPFTDFGIRKSFFDELMKKDLCSLTFGCAGIKEDVTSINLQRVPVEEYSGNLKQTLKKEYLYHSILKLFGKAGMKR